MTRSCDVAACIGPAYTGDESRARLFWPGGYGEWPSVKAAGPRFPGHEWPRRPRWDEVGARYGIPYFPHVSVGWDTNPRHGSFGPGVVTDAAPAEIEQALRAARDGIDARPGRPPLVTVNSGNEWTESSHLQPDDRHGYGCLEAVRRVFADPARTGGVAEISP